MKIRQLILALGVTSFTSLISASGPLNCIDNFESTDEYGWKTVVECSQGRIIKQREFHRTGALTSLLEYDRLGREVVSRSWNVEGKPTRYLKSSYDKGTRLDKKISVFGEFKGEVENKSLYELVGDKEYLVKDWSFSKRSLSPYAIKHFKRDVARPYRIDVIDKSENLIKYYIVDYLNTYAAANLVPRFKSYSPDGELLGSYDEHSKKDIFEIIKSQNISQKEIQRQLNIFNDKSREPVVIIDTGFDIMHPTLSYKLYNSPHDSPYDGVDNDGNGRVDDSWGWHRQEDPGINIIRDDRNIKETHSLIHTPYPVSHGTHVASLALRGLESFGLVGFAGDVAIADHLKDAQEYINEKKIKFVNMSFAIGYPGAPMSAPRESFYYLENLFSNNPQTLFVVAAGNGRGGLDIDLAGNDNYPASYDYENMIKVGAINSPDLNEGEYSNYKKAFFSKFGKRKVQIFAPGQQVVSAQSGGGTIALNGTSMATPYALNVILKAHELNKSLSPMQLKEVVLKTAYVPEGNPFECQSGGVIVPRRVYMAVKELKSSTGISIEEAVFKSRRSIKLEGDTVNTNDLQSLWRSRGLN